MIKLKKLISRKEEANILRAYIQTLNVPIRIISNDEVIYEYNVEKGEILEKYFPITFQDETIGWLWGNDDSSKILELINYILSSEQEKKVLAAETLGRYRELVLLYEFSSKIGLCLDINEVAKLVITEAIKYIPTTVAALMLQDSIKGNLKVAAEFNNDGAAKNVINPENGILKWVMNNASPDIVNDLEKDPRYIEGSVKISSMICAPIIVKAKTIGVIAFGSKNKIAYTSENLKLFNAIAFQTSVAIENAKLYGILEETFFQTVKTLAETIEMRDPYTGGHTQRVMNYSLTIGTRMGLSKSDLAKLKLAALMHDIGKIGIGDNILLKNEILSDIEYVMMRKHSEYGSDILKNIKQLKEIIPGVREHHERYDGSGYPDGLKGDSITLIGRIIAVADSFDAMTSHRPYRKALSVDEAINQLMENSGSQFDPSIVGTFINIYKEKGEAIIDKTKRS